MRRALLGTAVLGALALTACSQPAPAPAPAPPASTSASPTPTSASPTPTPTPSPTPTQVLNPLNGLPEPAGIDTTRPALIVKIDNVGGALPQTGLPKADLVVEQPMEGGLTRFEAVFWSQTPTVVGPIRSARPVDAEIARMLGPTILMFSGASPYEIAPVKADSHALLIADDWDTAPGTFHRNPDKSGEHNLYGEPAKAWAFGAKNGAKTGPPNQPLAFTAEKPAGSTSAKAFSLDFGDTRVRWEWDAAKSRWLRWQNGNEHDDADSGQLGATTVLVVQVPVHYSDQIHDVLGTPTPLITTVGSGKGWLYREGTLTKVTWTRPTVDSPMTLTGPTGVPVGPVPGQTWIELLPKPHTPDTTP